MVEIKIPEKDAINIISTYEGGNNYILDLQKKISSKYYKLTRTQVDYVLTNHTKIPLIARKYTPIDAYLSEQLQEKKMLPIAPPRI